MMEHDKLDYLLNNLRANPVYNAAEIVSRRQQLLGRASAPMPASSDKQEARREAVAKRLNQLREKFWVAPLGSLKENLASLPTSQFPDLDLAASRLKQLVVYRPDFARLTQHKHCNTTLCNAMRAVIVLPPAKAGAMRERANRTLSKVPPGALRRMIKMMKREFPHLYEMEEDWLKEVGGLAKYNKDSSGQPANLLRMSIVGAVVVVTLVFVIGGVVSFIDGFGGGFGGRIPFVGPLGVFATIVIIRFLLVTVANYD